MRALLDSAVEAFHAGITQQPTRRASLKEEEDAARELLLMPFSASDRVTLARISVRRERALSLARSGDLDEATKVMDSARLLMSLAQFSARAEPVARTAHYAAVSYLSYRRGDYARARQEMEEALRETDRISDMTGDNATLSARRVHLVHNIMRVSAAAGSTAEVPRLGFAVLLFLADGPAEWPSGFGCGPVTKPDSVATEHQSNKIAETIAEAIEALSEAECQTYSAATKRLMDCPQPPAPRVWAWLSLMRWQFENRTEEFLSEAAPFLRSGPGATPILWYAVALDVLESSREHTTKARMRATEAMVSAMLTSSATPSFVRTRVASHHNPTTTAARTGQSMMSSPGTPSSSPSPGTSGEGRS